MDPESEDHYAQMIIDSLTEAERQRAETLQEAAPELGRVSLTAEEPVIDE